MGLAKKRDFDSQRGMTLMEVLLGFVLSSIFFCALSSVWLMGFKQYYGMRQEQQLFYEVQKIRQFILDEVDVAEMVCIYVYPDEVGHSVQTIDLAHKSHNTEGVVVPRGQEMHIKEIIFDKGKVSKWSLDLSTRLKRVFLTGEADVFELNFQGNPLTEQVTKWMLRKEGDVSYMTLEVRGRAGESHVFTFTLPLEDKEEKKSGVQWVSD